MGRLMAKDMDDPPVDPVDCADIDADGYWTSEKKLLKTPAGRKDPPGGEQGDDHGEAQDGPPWTVVKRGKSSGSRWGRPG